MVQKLHICENVYFDQLLDFPKLLLLFLHSFLVCCAIFCSLNSGSFQIPPGCQTVGSRSGPTSGLTWVQTFCKDFQQMTKVATSWQKLNAEQLLDTTFWLKARLKSISFGSNFSILLKCWLQTILSQGKLFLVL